MNLIKTDDIDYTSRNGIPDFMDVKHEIKQAFTQGLASIEQTFKRIEYVNDSIKYRAKQLFETLKN